MYWNFKSCYSYMMNFQVGAIHGCWEYLAHKRLKKNCYVLEDWSGGVVMPHKGQLLIRLSDLMSKINPW